MIDGIPKMVAGLEPWNFIFPKSWDDDPIWRTHIFQWVETTN